MHKVVGHPYLAFFLRGSGGLCDHTESDLTLRPGKASPKSSHNRRQVRVTFEPQGRSAYVLRGAKLPEAAADAGLTIDQPCGGAGTCGKCRVQVTGGACEPNSTDRAKLSPQELSDGWRLACQTTICEQAVVHVPEGSLFGSDHQILAQRQQGGAQEVLPAVRKVHVTLPAPTLDDPAADMLRLGRLVGPVKADLAMLRELPAKMRACRFDGTAVLADNRLIDFEAGDTTNQCFGAAFDIGTTTMVGSLLNLCTGHEAAIAACVNPQVRFGDDVVSRIKHASSDRGLKQLQAAVGGAVAELLADMCRQAGVAPGRIYEAAFAGNATMEHLLCGIDPTAIGRSPFSPAFAGGLAFDASELATPIHPRGRAYVFPVIGGFVGGDTVAGIVATALAEQDGPVLMVDIGTNGQIVLADKGRLWAASTAAGPAFEGARITCGMRATKGAIEKVVFDRDVRCGVIGQAAAVGLCGSGLIDIAAELLRHGVITPDGRMLGPSELPAALPAQIAARLTEGRDGRRQFVLVRGRRPKARDVVLTQRDVRELQLAAGAIRAGVAVLLRQAGVGVGDLKRVLIAGGFGSFIRRSNAQRIGLLPEGLPHERIAYVGNVSLEGCKCALLSTAARERAETSARQAQHVELSTDAGFQAQFAEAMIFPNN